MKDDRLKSLKRIEAVQKRMVTLANMRLSAAERLCRDITNDKTILGEFIGQEEALSPALAKTAMRTGLAIDAKLVRAKHLQERQADQLAGLKRREHVVSALVDAEEIVVKRREEDRDLRETIEAWQAQDRASLP